VSACPSCRRPVAVARATCLYCGVALPADAVEAAAAAAQQVRAESISSAGTGPLVTAPASERHLVVVEVRDQAAALLSRLLDLSSYDAALRLRQGGTQLHRAARDLGEANAEADRLRGEGLEVFVIPEAEARRPPVVATGGRCEGQRLELRTTAGPLTVEGASLLLVVKGPIRREYQSREIERKKPSAASLEAGYRFHLHRRGEDRPVELDPAAFTFGKEAPLTGSSLLELSDWLATIAGTVPVDDAFRRLPPALGTAGEEVDATSSLRGARGRSSLTRRKDAPAILDNLGQFRFYSGWRAGVERRR